MQNICSMTLSELVERIFHIIRFAKSKWLFDFSILLLVMEIRRTRPIAISRVLSGKTYQYTDKHIYSMIDTLSYWYLCILRYTPMYLYASTPVYWHQVFRQKITVRWAMPTLTALINSHFLTVNHCYKRLLINTSFTNH